MKKCCAFLCLLLISVMFSSCTYADFENKLKKGIMPGNDDKVDMNEFDQQAKPDENTQLKQIGDEIIINDSIAELSYTVTKVTVYDNLKASGIDEAKVCGYVPDNAKQNLFVLVDITVKNKKVIRQVDDYNIGVFHLMNKTLFDSDPWKQSLPELTYFSNAKNNGSEYYHYTLPEGEEMQCQLGWVLRNPIENADDLILHIGADISAKNYVRLTKVQSTNEGSDLS